MANKVSYLVQLKDRFSAVGEKFSRQFKGIDRSVAGANTQLKRFNMNREKMRAMSGSFARAGAVMSATMTVPAVMLGKSMIDAASDAQETANKFNEVFKGINAQANASAKTLSSGYQLATSSAQEMLSTSGDLLVGLGFTREEALKMSEDIIKLSSDVASFKNVQGGAERASNALTKALLGEREMLKETFKVALLEEDVKARAAIIKRRDRGLSEQQAKAMATLAIVTERNKDAVGDLARTSDDYANVARRNAQETKALSESMGVILLPIATKTRQILSTLINKFSGLSETTKTTVLVIGGLLAIGVPLLLLLAGIATAFTFMSAPILIVSAAVLALIAALGVLAYKWDSIKKSFEESTFLKAGAATFDALTNPISFISRSIGMGDKQSPDQSRSTPVNKSGGTVDGQITVSAAPGSKVEKTQMKNSGGGLNLGMNMAGAY